VKPYALSTETPRWLPKVDHRLRALWARVPEGDRARHSVKVFLRFSGSDASLKGLGAQVHSVAGDIASSTIMLIDLPHIASAAQVIFIELAQVLGQDR
jgi:hypothetical protein